MAHFRGRRLVGNALSLIRTNNPSQPWDMGRGTMTVSNTPWAQGPANFQSQFWFQFSTLGPSLQFSGVPKFWIPAANFDPSFQLSVPVSSCWSQTPVFAAALIKEALRCGAADLSAPRQSCSPNHACPRWGNGSLRTLGSLWASDGGFGTLCNHFAVTLEPLRVCESPFSKSTHLPHRF